MTIFFKYIFSIIHIIMLRVIFFVKYLFIIDMFVEILLKKISNLHNPSYGMHHF